MFRSIGQESLSSGRDLEHDFKVSLYRLGWLIESGPLLDYAQKIDFRATCKGMNSFNLQVSRSPKSRRAIRTLGNRGIDTVTANVSSPKIGEYICNNICGVDGNTCPFRLFR
ncbi:MAG: hypothetical protein QG647_76 [Patescibacteria group bacterium]|nr:hypothetical protein [Patescibacteria group bacterium]